MRAIGLGARWFGLRLGLAVAVAVALVGAGVAAQQQAPVAGGRPRTPPVGQPGSNSTKKAPGGLRLPGDEKGKREEAGKVDPLAPGRPPDEPRAGLEGADPAGSPAWPFHYTFRLRGHDGQALPARYYPSRLGAMAPVVLMVHEIGPGRSGRDFEEPIGELEGKGLASHLQLAGFAVLVMDSRGHGENVKRVLTPEEWRSLSADLRAAYHFLLDRHNRRELNVGKFGVVGLGEGANLAAWWASRPGAAVSVEGRSSDLACLVLISPLSDDRGIRLAPIVASLAPRFPMLLVAGEADAPSAEAVKASQQVVERQRLGRVSLVEGRQHGYNLLHFTPGGTKSLLSFLENTLKNRTDEWEPRYNLAPVAYVNVRIVDSSAPPARALDQPVAEPTDQPRSRTQPAEKKNR